MIEMGLPAWAAYLALLVAIVVFALRTYQRLVLRERRERRDPFRD